MSPLEDRLAANPFPGLRSFNPEEAEVFFGRQQQIDELLLRLDEVSLIAVAGASGCGKSSLVLAGLLHALEKRHADGHPMHWRPVVMRPGAAPITNLAGPLAAALASAADDDATRAIALAGRLHLGADALVQAVRRARLPARQGVLVVVDQFEEIFRYKRMTDPEECAAFVKLLLQAARVDDCPLKVVLTLRSDALGSCADFGGLPEAVSRGQFLVPRLTREQRKQAIVGPVEHQGFQIAPRLVQRVLNDVSDDFDDLPVMQHALACSWRRWAVDAQGGRAIDLVDYEAIGTSERALSQHADEAFDSLPGLGEVVEGVFRALTERIDTAGSEVRRPMHFTRLCQVTGAQAEQVAQVVERYRRADTVFLLPSASVPLQGDPLIDIAHESLIRGWTRLKAWAEREALSAQAYGRIASAANPVDGRPPAFLRDPALQFALDWRQQNRPNAHWAALYDAGFDDAMAFLEASRQARDAEREAAARTARRRKWTAVAVTLGSVALALVMAAMWQGQRAASERAQHSEVELRAQELQERGRGESRGLAFAASKQLAANRMDVALVLGASALQDPAADEAQEIMRKVMLDAPLLILRNDDIAKPSQQGVFQFNGLRFSPDGVHLAAVSSRGDLLLWDAVQRRLVASTRRALDGQHDVFAAFATDGTLMVSPDAKGQAAVGDGAGALRAVQVTGLAAAGDAALDKERLGAAIDAPRRRYARAENGGGVGVWDLQTGALMFRLPSVPVDTAHLQFSDDGRLLATLQMGRGVQVWNVANAAAPQRPALHINANANAFAFSHDSRFIAVASVEGSTSEVVVWDLAGGAKQRRLAARGGTVEVLAYGASSDILAWGQSDGLVMFWDLAAKPERSRWDKPHGVKGVSSLVFSRDGRQMATGDADGVLALWSVDDQALVRRLKAWSEGVDRLAFSSDGKRLASAHRDGTVMLHDVADSGVRHGEFRAGLDAAAAVAFDPRGGRLAMASEDSSVQFWELASGHVHQEPLRGHDLGLTSLSYSRDGELLASGSQDTRIRLWNARSGVPLGEALPVAHTDQINALAFNHEGSLLASAGDNTVIVWDLATRMPLWQQARHRKEAMAVAFSPDGLHVASAGREGDIGLWDARSGREIWKTQQNDVEIYALAFNPDGRTLASGGSKRNAAGSAAGLVQFWNATDGTARPAIEVAGNRVRSIAFDSPGQRLATGADDGMLRLWDVRQHKAIGQAFEGHDKVITSVAFSPDGKTVSSVGSDRRIIVWDADVAEWAHQACAIVRHRLRPEAWPRNLDAKSPRRALCVP